MINKVEIAVICGIILVSMIAGVFCGMQMVKEKVVTEIQKEYIIIDEPQIKEVEVHIPVFHESIIEVIPVDYALLQDKAAELDAFKAEQAQHFEKLSKQYPEAYTIWKYLTEKLGLNNYVAAGIMGNIMNECGGNTLQLNPLVKNKYGCYGICQWSAKYYPQLDNTTLVEQLDFLAEDIIEIFNRDGYLYRKGFNYQSFCNLTSCYEAAEAFRIVYEKPSSASKATRQYNAAFAYSIFVK